MLENYIELVNNYLKICQNTEENKWLSGYLQVLQICPLTSFNPIGRKYIHSPFV